MPEPNFPDAPLVHLSFDLRPRTEADPDSEHAQVAQCNFQHADGTLTSFDPEQLPKFLAALLTPTVVTQADTIAKQVALIEAKDAYLTSLTDQAAGLEADKARLLLKLAEVEPSLTPKNPGPGSAAEPSLEP